MAWQDLTRKKREQVSSLIPPEWRLSSPQLPSRTSTPNVIDIVPSFLSAFEQEVTTLSAPQLLRDLHRGHFTAREVLAAFCHRAALAHQFASLPPSGTAMTTIHTIARKIALADSLPQTHCLSEINFQRAAARAVELDAHWRAHGTPIGPLHGLPVSLMDRFNVAGLDSTTGFASWVGDVKSAEDEGLLVQSLRALGAVVFCKTSMPMSMMVGETVNNIMGATLNPHNRMLSAGGACGGEGALIALKGSPLGIGTVVAGLSRIPAAFNGICALKAAEARLPQRGMMTVMTGLPTAAGAIGLLASDIDGLQTVFKALLSSSPWIQDPETLELPWRQEKFAAVASRTHTPGSANGRLVFGLLMCDGHVRPHPTTYRAMQIVKQALEGRGYEVLPPVLPPHPLMTIVEAGCGGAADCGDDGGQGGRVWVIWVLGCG